MANHKDAIKRARQNRERRLRNKAYRTRMRNQIKKLRQAIARGDVAEAQALLPQTVSIIQRVARKGIIHRRNASRRVSRLSRAVSALARQQAEQAQD